MSLFGNGSGNGLNCFVLVLLVQDDEGERLNTERELFAGLDDIGVEERIALQFNLLGLNLRLGIRNGQNDWQHELRGKIYGRGFTVLTHERRHAEVVTELFLGGDSRRNGPRCVVADKIVMRLSVKSSYPYIMLAFKFPMEKFTSLKNCNAAYILNSMNDYAFMFKFIAVNIRLKDDSIPMPALQYSKAVKIINPILDNGRVLAANYVEIYLNEYDLAVIEDQYFHEKHICTQVEFSHKAYLPRWFTDFVFESFKKKCYLEDGDPTAYNIAKSVVNSLYGMTVQHSIQDNIIEDYDYCSSSENEPYYKDTMQLPDESDAAYMQRMFEKEVNEYDIYLNKRGSILPYFWGVWVTSIAFYNLHQLVKCCETPYYCDTDSCYGSKWDQVKLEAYNQGCRDRITTNSYGAVTYKDRDIWLGIAESKGQKDEYSEFKYMGAKRYAGRCIADNELHITVAGVPKKKGALCLENDLDNFHPGFIFDGLKTGKTTHVYFYPDEIYTDENGNETGDSISLIPCDYELDSVNVVDWESLFNEKIEVQIYDEE